MRIIDTSTITDRTVFNPDDASWVYNGLDCAVTFEIRDVLRAQLAVEPDFVQETYANTLAKQAPIMEMSMRGMLVDEAKLQWSIKAFEKDLAALEAAFDEIIFEVFEFHMNWRSPTQLKRLFYDIMLIKPVRARNASGDYTPTLNRAALEQISYNYLAGPLCLYILAMRGLQKKLGFLRSEIDPDGCMRCSYNLAGTNTGRLSSRMNEFGTGTNLQNVERRLRFPFVARPQKILVNVDLEQSDARNVGARIYSIFADRVGPELAGTYLDACESGDLHTTVSRMAFTELPWPEDPSGWRAVADGPAYRDLTYRDMAKKLGHGTNYYGQPATMAKHTKTEAHVIESFQKAYFRAFPLIPEWHKWVQSELEERGYLLNLFGRRRYFWGRIGEASTLREAIAYDPQSSTGEEIDQAYLTIFRRFPECQLLNQVHDSILFEIDFDLLHDRLPLILAALPHRIILPHNRAFHVPLEAKVGWNWGDTEYAKDGTITNEYGLQKWKNAEKREPPSARYKKK